MGTRLCTWGLWSLLVLFPFSAWASSPVWGDCEDGASADLVALGAQLRAMVDRGGEADVRCLQTRIGSGLPPAALLVVLDAIDADRKPPLVAVAWDLARHRRPAVRSRALRVLAGYDGEWSHRAIILALGDREAAVRTAGYRLVVEYPSARYEATVRQAFERGEPGATAALAACGTQDLIMRLPQLRRDVPGDRWARLVGGLVRRPDLLTAVQRLGLVTTLVAMRTPVSLDELRLFVKADVALDEPTARNLAARSVGLPQDPKHSRRAPKPPPEPEE